jgi:beta-glucosidase/6-phospho-beta-glucosidase/beta-galactosidase/ABC-type amino acid transport substrate-binding protein
VQFATFPPAFDFGVATADHQCEAYVEGEDDIRDLWERVRGETLRGRATDFWNRFKEDVERAHRLGCTAFRLSLSWARLQPAPGQWSQTAFEHYQEVLRTIHEHGLKSVVTLHHNTWPVHVQEAGRGQGLLDPSFPDAFAAYAREVARRLGSQIDYYVTLNEPNQLIFGYVKPWWMRSYRMPPGLDRYAGTLKQMRAVELLIPNLFLAHARARAAIHRELPGAKVGANPFILGLPAWLQMLLDWNATHLQSREQLYRHGTRIAERSLPQWGKVDVALAHITFDSTRSGQVLFSESYLITRIALLTRAGSARPARVGVVKTTIAARRAADLLPGVDTKEYDSLSLAMAAFSRGEIDGVLDDEVTLLPFNQAGTAIRPLENQEQAYCAAVAPGNRALLNAVDIAIRNFKDADVSDPSGWRRSVERWLPQLAGDPPRSLRRATLANLGSTRASRRSIADIPRLDGSLQRIRRRGFLRVGVAPGIPGLCMSDGKGDYSGLEPDLARALASEIFGSADGHVRFVPIEVDQRLSATRSPFRFVERVLRVTSAFSTIITTNWWNLGMAGRLAPFLCPPECVGALDFVGIDYYWGVNRLSLSRLTGLLAAMEGRYRTAPVWPRGLYDVLARQAKLFPNLRLIVIENGCVTVADGFSRADYLQRHLVEVQRAVSDGVPVDGYMCWSLTSNREWGLPFDDSSDFGLYHIDLEGDDALRRTATDASVTYQRILARRSAT